MSIRQGDKIIGGGVSDLTQARGVLPISHGGTGATNVEQAKENLGLNNKADLIDGKIPEGQLPEMDYIPNDQKGAAEGVASLGSDGKVPTEQLPESKPGLLPQIIVTAPTGSTVMARKGDTTLTATESGGVWVFNVPDYGTWTISATKDSESDEGEVLVQEVRQYEIELKYVRVYGTIWDGTSTTAWSRTDNAADFTDPVPYVAGSNNYGSPFDDVYPWSEIKRVTDAAAGELVEIPKFWYKWTKSGNSLKLQIADGPEDGFFVSPAHADRGDGKGERDKVYVGRYNCASSNYKSMTATAPKTKITRSVARSGIHALSSDIWQFDMAMRVTIQMLYLVEFADWNSQTRIGYGCGNNSAAQNVGASDAMPYHTGTMQSSRTTYGVGVQYRYIEDLWGNVLDWMDGCYYNSNGLNIINAPSAFSDSAGGTAVGVPSSGYPSAMAVSDKTGLEWVLYPTEAKGSDGTYVPDVWSFNAPAPGLYCGGYYSQFLDRGLFYVNGESLSGAYDLIGCRLMKLP